MQFLPTEDVRLFLVELVKTLRSSADLGNMAALEPVIAAWKDTAEIYADPELRKAATTALDGTDYGEIPESCRLVSPKRLDRVAPPPIED